MFSRLIQTEGDIAPTPIRITLGVVIFAHGAQKVFGWFGGRGFEASMAVFTESYNIPLALAFIGIMGEFLGSLGLIVGLLSRIAAFGVAMTMIFAIIIVTGSQGFFINWAGTRPAGQEGYEFGLLAIAMGLTILIKGGGALSLDRMLYTRLNRGD